MSLPKPIKELAEKYGKDKSTVAKWVRKCGAETTVIRREEGQFQAEKCLTDQGLCDLKNYLARRNYQL